MDLVDKMSFHHEYLNFTESIVKYSFIVHQSTTSLDISLQEYSAFKKKRTRKMIIVDTPIEISDNYVCSKEGLQKNLSPFQTQLINSLNLDLCRDRQETVRGLIEDRHMINRAKFHDYLTIYDIYPQFHFYERTLNQFIEDAIRNNIKKDPIFKLYLKMLKQDQFGRYHAFSSSRRHFFDALYKECSDSQLIVDTLKAFNFETWIIDRSYPEPEQLEFFLDHLYFLNKGKEILIPDLIHMCIAEYLYKNAQILLKYQDTPTISRRSYEQTLSRLRDKRGDLIVEEMEYLSQQGQKRVNSFFAIQTLLIFLSHSTSAYQALRLLWRSTPSRFLTLDDFKATFGRMLTSKEIEGIYNFYRDITGQDTQVCQPRMLKHSCRITVRAILWENDQLRGGIDKLGLPSDIRSYLKLKK